jgi:hypothetical protein
MEALASEMGEFSDEVSSLEQLRSAVNVVHDEEIFDDLSRFSLRLLCEIEWPPCACSRGSVLPPLLPLATSSG